MPYHSDKDININKFIYCINRNHNFFFRSLIISALSVVCCVFLHRSDYLRSGGFDTNLNEWGQEDVLLFKNFAQSNITVIRSPDPDIFHMWHHKDCPQSLSDDHYKNCIRSKVLNEGSLTELGYMLLSNEIERRRNQRKGL